MTKESKMLDMPNGPHLEFGFYHPARNDQTFFAAVVQSILAGNSQYVGYITLAKNAARPFESIYSLEELRDIPVPPNELNDFLANEQSLVCRVFFRDALGVHSESLTYLRYESVSDVASRKDNHPLLIVGEDCETPTAELSLYDKFIYYVSSLEVAYANISSEIGLECPTDLEQDSRSYAFQDFFLSKQFFEQKTIGHVILALDGYFIQELLTGFYFSSSADLNPDHVNIPRQKRPDYSVEVAKAVVMDPKLRTAIASKGR
ncbi:MAG: hypothetical protein L0Y70_16915 [Gemmataceae bacterium]|nr:hypothetical protein [Gemmataceae bacterium]